MTWIFVKQNAVLWTPENLATTPEYWFDAEAITGLSNGDQVDTWTNLGSNSDATRDATNSETGYPKYVTNSLNGLAGLEWNLRADGTGTRLQSGVFAAKSSDLTAVAVWKTSFVSAGTSQIANASGYFELALNRTAARANVAWWNGAFAATTATTPTIGTTSAYMTSGVWDRTAQTRTIWVNGDEKSQAVGLGAHTFANNSNLVIGNNAYGLAPQNGQQFQGTIHEVIVCPTASITERQKIEGYLAHKWGIASDLPAGHPYKSSAPTV